MKRRFKSRPTPAMSALAAIVGVIMLIFAAAVLSQAKTISPGGMAFMIFWVVGLIGIIIFHVTNATKPGGVPTEIIESEDDVAQSKSTAERLQELEDLRSRKLVSDSEYESKRQDILREV